MTPESTPSHRKLSKLASFWGEGPQSGDYWEDFTKGSRGWIANSQSQLEIGPEGAICRGPWIVDANHAPPGAGYLHLLMHIHTLEERLHAPYTKESNMYPDDFLQEKRHAFIHGGHSRNLIGSKVRTKIRGQFNAQGSQVTVLVQAQPDPSGPRANWVFTGGHYEVSPDWSYQELTLAADPSQWTFLGSRHDLTNLYGYVPLEEVLRDVNVSLIFILYPLTIEPVHPVADRHLAWAGRDYEVRPESLPSGRVEFEHVWLKYA